ncbi:hypothetical protein JCM8547_004562 [Rhodosporidiobolus lusitaniae]
MAKPRKEVVVEIPVKRSTRSTTLARPHSTAPASPSFRTRSRTAKQEQQHEHSPELGVDDDEDDEQDGDSYDEVTASLLPASSRPARSAQTAEQDEDNDEHNEEEAADDTDYDGAPPAGTKQTGRKRVSKTYSKRDRAAGRTTRSGKGKEKAAPPAEEEDEDEVDQLASDNNAQLAASTSAAAAPAQPNPPSSPTRQHPPRKARDKTPAHFPPDLNELIREQQQSGGKKAPPSPRRNVPRSPGKEKTAPTSSKKKQAGGKGKGKKGKERAENGSGKEEQGQEHGDEEEPARDDGNGLFSGLPSASASTSKKRKPSAAASSPSQSKKKKQKSTLRQTRLRSSSPAPFLAGSDVDALDSDEDDADAIPVKKGSRPDDQRPPRLFMHLNGTRTKWVPDRIWLHEAEEAWDMAKEGTREKWKRIVAKHGGKIVDKPAPGVIAVLPGLYDQGYKEEHRYATKHSATTVFYTWLVESYKKSLSTSLITRFPTSLFHAGLHPSSKNYRNPRGGAPKTVTGGELSKKEKKTLAEVLLRWRPGLGRERKVKERTKERMGEEMQREFYETTRRTTSDYIRLFDRYEDKVFAKAEKIRRKRAREAEMGVHGDEEEGLEGEIEEEAAILEAEEEEEGEEEEVVRGKRRRDEEDGREGGRMSKKRKGKEREEGKDTPRRRSPFKSTIFPPMDNDPSAHAPSHLASPFRSPTLEDLPHRTGEEEEEEV